MAGKSKSAAGSPAKKLEGFQLKIKPKMDKPKPASKKKAPAVEKVNKVPSKSPSKAKVPVARSGSESDSESGSETDETVEVNPANKTGAKNLPRKSPPKTAKPGSPARAMKPSEDKSGSSSGSDSDNSDMGLSFRKAPRSSPAKKPVEEKLESSSGSDSEDSSDKLLERPKSKSATPKLQSPKPAERTESKSSRRDLTSNFNAMKPAHPKSSGSESDTSYDSAEERHDKGDESDDEGETSPPSKPGPSNAKTDVKLEEDVAEGGRIVVQMSEEDLHQLLERIECACPVLDKTPAKKRASAIKWEEIAFSKYDADTCRKAWAYLQLKRRHVRNMWEIVHEVKCSLDTETDKFRKAVLANLPGCPKKPAGVGGGLNMYVNIMYSQMKEGNKSKVNYLQWYNSICQKYRSLPDSEKKIWEAKSDKLKQKFLKENEEFQAHFQDFLPRKRRPRVRLPSASKSSSSPARVRAKSVPRDLFPDAPKPPKNPLETFIQSKLEGKDPPPLPDEIDELKVKYGNKWHQLDDSKKAKVIGKVITAAEEYLQSVQDYRTSHPGYKSPTSHKILNILTRAELSLWEISKGRPEKPPASAAGMFYNELKSSGEMNHLERDVDKKAYADQKYAALSYYDKETYKLQHKQLELKYMKDVAEYFQNVPEFLRSILLSSIDKKYRHQITSVGKGDEDGSKSPKKRKGTTEAGGGKSRKKKKTAKENEATSTNHVLEEIEEVREDLEAPSTAEPSSPKKKKKKNEILYEVIRGIFDARQALGRRYSIFYYYARYVATSPTWIIRLEELGLERTGLFILEALARLSKLEKQTFISYSRNFHNERYYSVKLEEGESLDHCTGNQGLTFPQEPQPPPRWPKDLYNREMKSRGLETWTEWKELDPDTRRLYHRKLYKLAQSYAQSYEQFAHNMTPNDLIEYLVVKTQKWEKVWNTPKHIRRAAKGFMFPLLNNAGSELDDYTAPNVLAEQERRLVAQPIFNRDDFLKKVAQQVPIDGYADESGSDYDGS